MLALLAKRLHVLHGLLFQVCCDLPPRYLAIQLALLGPGKVVRGGCVLGQDRRAVRRAQLPVEGA
eukprot:578558-Pyramimonas_sp.AAC.1